MSTPTVITAPEYQVAVPPPPPEPPERREWMYVALGLTAFVAVIAIVIALVALARDDGSTAPVAAAPHKAAVAAADKPAPTLAQSKGINFEKFERVDPTLPAVPAG